MRKSNFCIINVNEMTDRLTIIVFGSLFFTSYYLRGIVLPESIERINIIGVIGIVVLMLLKLKVTNKFDLKMTGIILFLIMLFVVSQIMNRVILSLSGIYFCCVIAPLFLLSVSIEKQRVRCNFNKMLKILNYFVIILLLIGCMDAVSDKAITKILVNIFQNNRYKELALAPHMNGRYFSFLGHPLYNKSVFIIFFVFNVLNNMYFEKKMPNIMIIMIAGLGIAITGSKTGFILLFAGIVVMGFRNIRIFLTQCLVGIFILNTGVFNNTLSRFEESLTSNRSELGQIVSYYNYYPIKFLNGYGPNFTFYYNEVLNGASAAFEYPFKLFALEYGTLFTIVIYVIFFIILQIFIRRKQFYLVVSFCIIFIDFNTYNAIGLAQDGMLMMCVAMMYLKNISNYISPD